MIDVISPMLLSGSWGFSCKCIYMGADRLRQPCDPLFNIQLKTSFCILQRVGTNNTAVNGSFLKQSYPTHTFIN